MLSHTLFPSCLHLRVTICLSVSLSKAVVSTVSGQMSARNLLSSLVGETKPLTEHGCRAHRRTSLEKGGGTRKHLWLSKLPPPGRASSFTIFPSPSDSPTSTRPDKAGDKSAAPSRVLACHVSATELKMVG